MLIDELKKTWATHRISPYGLVVAVPSREFRNEWKEQLEAEGIKIYSQAYNGASYFFLKEKNEAQEAKPIQRKPKRRWTSQDDSLLKDLYSQSLPVRDIGSKLDRSRIAVQHRLQRLGLLTNSQAINKEVANDDSLVVKEYLACVSELYPRYPSVCKLLLREASNKINV